MALQEMGRRHGAESEGTYGGISFVEELNMAGAMLEGIDAQIILHEA